MSDADQIETEARQHRQALREDLDAIFDRLSPGQMIDEFLSSTGGVNRFASSLGAQVRDNPMPVILTAAGLAWLAAGSRGSGSGGGTSLEMHAGPAAAGAGSTGHVEVDPDDYDADFHHRRVEIAEAGCVRLETDTDETYEDRLAQARAEALGIDRDEGEDGKGFRDRVNEQAAITRDKAKDARRRIADNASKARRGVSGAAGSAKHAVQGAAGSAKHGAQKAGAATKDAARSGANSVASLHESNPVATGAVALAAGALIGALLPLTRQEHDTLAEPADKASEQAARAAQKAAQTARDTREEVEARRSEGNGSASSGNGSAGDNPPPAERTAPPPPATH
ncbi:MAG: hypothetical protein ABL308_02310 [Oceanicaulis sp.]